MWSRRERLDPLLNEAKRILLFQMEEDSNGHLRAVDRVRFPVFGSADGEAKVRFGGITVREFFYESDHNDTKTLYTVAETMKEIGRRVDLRYNEDAVCCLVKTYIFYPVLLVFFVNEEGTLQLSTFTGRSLTAVLATNLALDKLDKRLPESMKRMMSTHSIRDVCKTLVYYGKRVLKRESLPGRERHLRVSGIKAEKELARQKKKLSREEAAWKRAEKRAEAKKQAADKAAAKKAAAWKKAEERAAALKQAVGEEYLRQENGEGGNEGEDANG